MPVSVKIDIKGIEKLKKKFNAMSRQVNPIIREHNLIYSERMLKTARALAPVDLGKMRNMIKIQSMYRGLAYKLVSTAPYTTEYGTPAGTEVPPKQLVGWCIRHGMPGLEYAVAKKIELVGSPPQPYILPAFKSQERSYKIMLGKKIRKLVES